MKNQSLSLGKVFLLFCLFWTTQASTQVICEDIYTPNQDNCFLGTLCLNCDGSFTFTGSGVASHINVGYFNPGWQWDLLCNQYSGPCAPSWTYLPGTVNSCNQATIQFQYYDFGNFGCNGQPGEVHVVDMSALYAANCPPDIELAHTNVLCQSPNGSASVVGHPLPNHSYNWERDGVQVGTVASLDCLPAGTYCVTVTDNNTWCTSTDCVTVSEVTSTIITENGGDTGISVGGIKLAAGQELTWWFRPLRIPDEMVLEWAPTPAFNNVTTLLNTGPVTSRGTACSPNPQCGSLLHTGDYAPGTNIPSPGAGGNGIDILTGSAEAHPTNNSTNCTNAGRRIQGCVSMPAAGWVRLIVNPNACGTTGTRWTVRVSCGCTINLKKDEDVLLRSLSEEEEPFFDYEEILEEENWIYPNPSMGLFYFNSESKVSSVEVYDSRGRVITEKSGIIESLDLTDENPGIYLVKMKGEFGEKAQKIIIQQ